MNVAAFERPAKKCDCLPDGIPEIITVKVPSGNFTLISKVCKNCLHIMSFRRKALKKSELKSEPPQKKKIELQKYESIDGICDCEGGIPTIQQKRIQGDRYDSIIEVCIKCFKVIKSQQVKKSQGINNKKHTAKKVINKPTGLAPTVIQTRLDL